MHDHDTILAPWSATFTDITPPENVTSKKIKLNPRPVPSPNLGTWVCGDRRIFGNDEEEVDNGLGLGIYPGNLKLNI